jgi:hypothetical protein
VKDIRRSVEADYEPVEDGLQRKNSDGSCLAGLELPAREAECGGTRTSPDLLFHVPTELAADVLVAACLIVRAGISAGAQAMGLKRAAADRPGLRAIVRMSLRMAGAVALIYATLFTVCGAMTEGSAAGPAGQRWSVAGELQVADAPQGPELRWTGAAGGAR